MDFRTSVVKDWNNYKNLESFKLTYNPSLDARSTFCQEALYRFIEIKDKRTEFRINNQIKGQITRNQATYLESFKLIL
jgi:hypothetical protein